MASTGPQSSELGSFLKSRRTQLSPSDVGLTDNGSQRRVSGLRREEVAQLAAISVDYYTRLEQGRVQASQSVLETLSRALRLDDEQQTYLYELAGKNPAKQRRRQPQRVRPAMQRLLDQLTETPALVLGRRMDVLAWNAEAAALYLDFAEVPDSMRNYVRLLFSNPTFRGLHLEWEAAARSAVASLRMEAARNPDDPQLSTLVGDLSVQDPDFRKWWASHAASTASGGTKRYRHPIVGDLTLDCDVWDSPDGSEQHLMVLTAEPSTSSHQGLKILASWAAIPNEVTPREATKQRD